MNKNEKTEDILNEESISSGRPRPLRTLNRVDTGRTAGEVQGAYHGLHEAPPTNQLQKTIEEDTSNHYRGAHEASSGEEYHGKYEAVPSGEHHGRYEADTENPYISRRDGTPIQRKLPEGNDGKTAENGKMVKNPKET